MKRLPVLLVAVLTASLLAACGGTSSAPQYAVGDCFDDTPELLEGGELGQLPIIDCDEPHDNEVFHVASYPGSTYNVDSLRDFTIQECLNAFEPFVGVPYEMSMLDFGVIMPSESSWENADDRQIVCMIYRMDLQKVTGTLRDAGI